jgi:superoxide dismutase, Cu-Zn family
MGVKMMAARTVICGMLAAGLASCGSPDTTEPAGDMEATTATAAPASAIASLQTATGEPAGTATATNADGKIMIALEVQGMPPGEHGAHVHTTGECVPPKFESAGGHWNPAEKQHGLENPQGQHAGDLPNLNVGDDGRGTLQYELKGGTFEQLLDSDGAAFVIHAKADDQRTNPSGESGDRLACGVFRR